ncbi:hypothetical protein DsansV1_C04g0045261 [Dioscorea sansibarensis]
MPALSSLTNFACDCGRPKTPRLRHSFFVARFDMKIAPVSVESHSEGFLSKSCSMKVLVFSISETSYTEPRESEIWKAAVSRRSYI